MTPKRTCSMDGCESHVVARGLCGKHYQAKRKSGEMEVIRPHRAGVPDDPVVVGDVALVPLTAGKFATVDISDLGLVEGRWWSATRSGNTWYAVSRHALLHRVIMGFGPDDPDVDHIDMDGLNNRRSNLRGASRSQNMANTRARGSTSRFKGVSWSKQNKKWTAQVRRGAKMRCLGHFDDEVAAALAYDAAAIETWGEFARVNFPRGQQ